MDPLLSASAEYVYRLGKPPLEAARLHSPFFLVIPQGNPRMALREIWDAWKEDADKAGGDFEPPIWAAERMVELGLKPEAWRERMQG